MLLGAIADDFLEAIPFSALSLSKRHMISTGMSTEMATPKLSANLGFLWPDRPVLDRIDAAAKAGFQAIEMHWPYATPPNEVRKRCALHDVVLLGINTPIGSGSGDFGLAAQVGREREFRNAFNQAIDYAHEVDASWIHIMAGVVNPEQKAHAKSALLQNLDFAARVAPDLMLLLEPINQRDKPNYFYSTVGEVANIIEYAAAPNLKIMFDVYHVAVSEGDVLTKLQHHLPSVGHVQVAAVPSRADPDVWEIAYGRVFAALDLMDYAGWVGCEYKPRAHTNDGLQWIDKLGISSHRKPIYSE
jgi:hydroxypyruvate isomerase